MKGILTKNLINLKAYGRISFLLIGMYVLFSFLNHSADMLASVIMLLCGIVPMSSMISDEQTHFDAYAQCMPVPRHKVVLAQYLTVLLVSAGGLLLTLAITALTSVQGPVNWQGQAAAGTVSLCAILLINALMLPAIYKLGVEKGRLVIMACVLGITLFVISLSGNLRILPGAPRFIFPVAAAALYLLSYLVSIRIYAKKEF